MFTETYQKRITGIMKGCIHVTINNSPENYNESEIADLVKEELLSRTEEWEAERTDNQIKIMYSCSFSIEGTIKGTKPSWDEDGGDPGEEEIDYSLNEHTEKELEEIITTIVKKHYNDSGPIQVTVVIEEGEFSKITESCL